MHKRLLQHVYAQTDETTVIQVLSCGSNADLVSVADADEPLAAADGESVTSWVPLQAQGGKAQPCKHLRAMKEVLAALLMGSLYCCI